MTFVQLIVGSIINCKMWNHYEKNEIISYSSLVRWRKSFECFHFSKISPNSVWDWAFYYGSKLVPNPSAITQTTRATLNYQVTLQQVVYFK